MSRYPKRMAKLFRAPGRYKHPVMMQKQFQELVVNPCASAEDCAAADNLFNNFRLLPYGLWKLINSSAHPYVRSLAVTYVVNQRRLVELAIRPNEDSLVRLVAVGNIHSENDLVRVFAEQKTAVLRWAIVSRIKSSAVLSKMYCQDDDVNFKNRLYTLIRLRRKEEEQAAKGVTNGTST